MYINLEESLPTSPSINTLNCLPGLDRSHVEEIDDMRIVEELVELSTASITRENRKRSSSIGNLDSPFKLSDNIIPKRHKAASVTLIPQNNQEPLFVQLINKEEDSDVILHTLEDNKQIFAHKLMLSTASDFFKSCFSINMREKNEKSVKLSEIDSEKLLAILWFIYSGLTSWPRDLRTELIPEIAEACVHYQVKSAINSLAKKLEDYFFGRRRIEGDTAQSQAVLVGLLHYEKNHEDESLITSSTHCEIKNLLEHRTRESLKDQFEFLFVLGERAPGPSMQDWMIENWIEGCGYRDVLYLLTMQENQFNQEVTNQVKDFLTTDAFLALMTSFCMEECGNTNIALSTIYRLSTWMQEKSGDELISTVEGMNPMSVDMLRDWLRESRSLIDRIKGAAPGLLNGAGDLVTFAPDQEYRWEYNAPFAFDWA